MLLAIYLQLCCLYSLKSSNKKTMKIKFYLSSLTLVLFALLGGGSFSGEDVGFFFTIILVGVGVFFVSAIIAGIVQSNNRKKRLLPLRNDYIKERYMILSRLNQSCILFSNMIMLTRFGFQAHG